MRVILAITALLLLAGSMSSAFAQSGGTIIDPELLPENRAIDQQYRRALKRLPDPEGSHDPWGTVRSDSDNGAKAKQASGRKPKTKTE
jgi:hypothetical protein